MLEGTLDIREDVGRKAGRYTGRRRAAENTSAYRERWQLHKVLAAAEDADIH